MKNRLKEIRKQFGERGKSQKAFAQYLGIPDDNLASYESGRRTPSESVIQLICQKCDINEEWLKTGNGEMHIKRTRNQELSDYFNRILETVDNDFKKRFFSALSKLDENDWKTLQKISEELSKEG